MQRKTVLKTIKIHAPKEKVWEVLLNDKFTRIWYAEFSEGSHTETDWKPGSKALFKDSSGTGLTSKVITNKAYEEISVQHEGVIINGEENFDSEEAKSWAGCKETYRLKDANGMIELSIEQEAPAKYYEPFIKMWGNALKKIKELAEGVRKKVKS